MKQMKMPNSILSFKWDLSPFTFILLKSHNRSRSSFDSPMSLPGEGTIVVFYFVSLSKGFLTAIMYSKFR